MKRVTSNYLTHRWVIIKTSYMSLTGSGYKANKKTKLQTDETSHEESFPHT